MKRPTVTNGQVTWYCDGCGQPIADRDGFLGVDTHEANRIGALWKEHNKTHPLSSMLSEMPEETATAWYAFHVECVPQSESGGEYSIGVERLRTLGHVLHWTGHLMEKHWLHWTNWDHMIRALGTPS